jgi:hypothetical protein
MVGYSADGEHGHRILLADRRDVSPKARLNIFGNEVETSFSREDQMYVVLCVAGQWCRSLVSRPAGLTIILFAFPDLTVGARLCRAFGALGNAEPQIRFQLWEK